MRRSSPRDPGPVDRLLDFAVVPGFTRIGWEIRSRSFEPLPRSEGRTVLITGASHGLGFAAARQCAAAGASLVLVSRDPERGREVAEEVGKLASPAATVEFHSCDLSDLAQVNALTVSLGKRIEKLDALVLNAGVLLHERRITGDGIEQAWATNVVGPYLLEHGLLGALEAAGGRVVMVTSGGAYTESLALPDGDLIGDSYDGPAVYARTKRAQIALAQLQAERFRHLGVTVHAVHPGWADTPGVKESLPGFRRLTSPLLRSAEEGADTISWLALADPAEIGNGLLWHDRCPRPRHRFPMRSDTAEQREELDAELQRLCGLGLAGQPPG